MKRESDKVLRDGLKRLNLKITRGQFQKLLDYARLVREGNQWVHLVSKKDEDRIVSKHILESLQAVPYLPKGCRCADIGSGAGFPGIPIKIVRPDVDMTLIEKKKKKALFLTEVIAKLNLIKITIIPRNSREIKNSFPILLSRLNKPNRLLKEIKHFLKQGNSLFLITNAGIKVFKSDDSF